MLVQVAMYPTDKGGGSVSEDVSKVIDIIDKAGLPHKLTAMSTIVEGEWEPIMAVLNKARKMLRRRHSRIYMVITIDDRKGAKKRLTGKIESIEKRLGRTVST